MNHEANNPYAAPQAELQRPEMPRAYTAFRSDVSAGQRNSVFGWVLMFCFNLPLSVYLGFMSCEGSGILGMVLAVAGLMSLTTFLFSRLERHFASCWLGGSVCVAFSQFVPYLHLHLGYFAVSRFVSLGLLANSKPLIFHQGLLCTLIVGGGLLGVSLGLATFFYLLLYYERTTGAAR